MYPFLSAGVFFKLGSLPPERDTTDRSVVSNPGGSEPSLKNTPAERKGYMFEVCEGIFLLTFYSLFTHFLLTALARGKQIILTI